MSIHVNNHISKEKLHVKLDCLKFKNSQLWTLEINDVTFFTTEEQLREIVLTILEQTQEIEGGEGNDKK